jgi:hypothetical protein
VVRALETRAARLPRPGHAPLWLTGAGWCDFVSGDDRGVAGAAAAARRARGAGRAANRVVRPLRAHVPGRGAAAEQAAAFFRTTDLALAREVLAYGTRALQARAARRHRAQAAERPASPPAASGSAAACRPAATERGMSIAGARTRTD